MAGIIDYLAQWDEGARRNSSSGRDAGDITAIADDVVSITINSNNGAGGEIKITESYEIKCSVMTVPAAFSLRLGWSDTAAKLLQLCVPGSLFQLRIGEVLIQTGIIDSRGVPSSDSTVVEIRGRDVMRYLMNSHVQEDVEFKEKTYYEITRRVLNLVGLGTHELVAGDGANRRAVTATSLATTKGEDQVRVIETGLPTADGSKVEFRSHKAKVGQRWWDWLQDIYKLSGLFLWCGGDGNLILASPNPDQLPAYELTRQRGVPRNKVNVLTHSFRDDCTNRHAKYIVYGRFGRGKAGRNRIEGEWIDTEMLDRGFADVITYHDDDVMTTAQAEILARRYGSEARRGGYHLEYTVAGHRVPSIFGGKVAVWGMNTLAAVSDDELGINGPHYIESVTFAMKPDKTTRLELIRPGDLLYLADEEPAKKRAAQKAFDAAQKKQQYGASGEWRQGESGNPGASGAWESEPGADMSWKWDADAPKPIPGYPGAKVNIG